MTSAFLGATLSHLPQPLLAVISFVYMDKSKHLLPLGYVFIVFSWVSQFFEFFC